MSEYKITHARSLINPAYSRIMGQASCEIPLEAIVEEKGIIRPIEPDILCKLKTKELAETDLEVGDTVYVYSSTCFTEDGLHNKRREQHERRKQIQKEKEQQEQRQAELRKQRRKEAEAFWNRHDIPFEYGTAINGRLGELSRGSTGTGKTSSTVVHLYVEEAFTDGRLERAEGTFLCNSSGRYPLVKEYDEDEHKRKVTCKQCQKLMRRWRTDG